MGIVGAAPLFESHPKLAVAFVFGSVAPDLDALNRVFGKRAFLRWHQTYSHSLIVIAGLVIALICLSPLVPSFAPLMAIAFGAGMAFHSLLDVSNTYGIKLFAPISKRRMCVEAVFFIDWIVIVVVAGLLGWFALAIDRGAIDSFARIGAVFWGFVVVYWGLRWLLRWRAGKLAPDLTSSLIPSTFVPWHFLGTCACGADLETYRINALSGRVSQRVRGEIA